MRQRNRFSLGAVIFLLLAGAVIGGCGGSISASMNSNPNQPNMPNMPSSPAAPPAVMQAQQANTPVDPPS